MTQKINKIIDKIINYGLIALLFIPIIVWINSLYPYVLWRSVFFRLVVEILFFLAVILFLNNKLFKLSKNFITISLILFLLAISIMSLFGVNPNHSLWGNFERMEGVWHYLHLMGYFLILVSFIRTEERWQKFFTATAVASILIDILALGQKFNFINYGILSYGGRAGGTLGNAAYLASTLMAATLILAYYFYKEKNQRKFSGTVIGLNILTIFVSATRGSILGLGLSAFIGLVLLLLKRNLLAKKTKNIIGIFLLVGILLSISIFVFKDSKLVQKIEPLRRISNISLEDPTVLNRIKIWDISIQAFKERPFTGWGLDNYYVAFNKYYQGDMTEEWFDRSHNQFLDVLVAGGILSFVLYLAFCVGLFFYIYKIYRQGKINYIILLVFNLGWLAYLVQNFFIFDTINNLVFIYLFLALLIFIDNKKLDNYFIEYRFQLNNFFKWFLGTALAVILVMMANFIVVKPVVMGLEADKAIDNFISDFSVSKEKYEIALAMSPYNFGREEILRSVMNIKDIQLNQEDRSNLDWAINLFEKQPILAYRNKIDLALLYNYKGEEDPAYFDKSIELLNSIKSESSKRQDIYFILGQAYALKGDKQKSSEFFSYALDLNQSSLTYWNIILNSIFFSDDAKVVQYTQEALDKGYKFNAQQIRYLVPILNKEGANEALEIILEHLLNLQPNNAEVMSDLALVKLRLGKEQEAIEYADKAVSANPQTKSILNKYFDF